MADDSAITSTDVIHKKKTAPKNESKIEAPDVPEEIRQLAEREIKDEPTREASRVLDGTDKERVLVKMERKNASWTTPSEVIFTQQHPFQLINEDEVDDLLDQDGFRRADPRELINFYGK